MPNCSSSRLRVEEERLECLRVGAIQALACNDETSSAYFFLMEALGWISLLKDVLLVLGEIGPRV